MERITEYLIADHERLHALLRRAGAGSSVDRSHFTGFRAGLLRHIAIEEKLLLAEVRRRLGAPLPGAHRLRIEHAALTSLLVPTPDPALLAEIESLLASHDAREEGEGGIYAQCEATLREASYALAERARSFGEVPLAPHFDGHGTVRTAREALASAERIRPPRGTAGA